MRTAAGQAGRQAALDGLAPSLNPFPANTLEHAAWLAGWNGGQDAINRYANHKPANHRDAWETQSERYIGGGVWVRGW